MLSDSGKLSENKCKVQGKGKDPGSFLGCVQVDGLRKNFQTN